MHSVQLKQHCFPLIGFAIKSRNAVLGFEAVRRGVKKNKIDLVLLNSNISEYTFKKLSSLLKRKKIPYFQTSANIDWQKLWGFSSIKILGIRKGNISQKILENFNSGV
jgi:ribosomal protein L7Ae-like RNA K-turn-binding protein